MELLIARLRSSEHKQLPNYPITRLPNSEEGDVDSRPFFDRALIRGNFDISVGLGQAGDVARSFEGGKGGATAEEHRIELVPAGL